MQFSVIIPTRNRLALLEAAIASVMRQSFDDFEIIVVNDGSDVEHNADFQRIEETGRGKIKILNLDASKSGHGASYSRNRGAAIAQGNYICFLDDDDNWIDIRHLEIANRILTQTAADVYFTNQQAYRNGQLTENRIWLAPLEDILKNQPPINELGAYQISVAQLMKVNGFAHLNTTILTSSLFSEIKGMDEGLRYENDRDFYLRMIDHAQKIIFNPIETSRHNIPDQKKTDNVSTLVNTLQKMVYRSYFLDKAILFSKHAEIRLSARTHKVYTLKVISEELYKQQKYTQAAYYAMQALVIGFGVKWSLFTGWIWLKSKLQPDSAS